MDDRAARVGILALSATALALPFCAVFSLAFQPQFALGRDSLSHLRQLICLQIGVAIVIEQAPLASVFHAAMVLEGRALGALDLATLERTLPVKTVGLRVLDLATREDELDAFVAFTTLAVMIGNPVQSASVAANAYQEVLMQARSAAGLPALALALGAITDAGYLTRDAALAKRIDQMSGNVAFPAASALRAMQKLLSLPDRAACVTITPMRWTSAAATLRTLKNPSHAVLRDRAAATSGTQAVGSLRQEIEALRTRRL